MNKEKIAISIDSGLLSLLDSKVDGAMLRSRSQAIEYFLGKGLEGDAVTTAVLILRGSQQAIALKQIQGKSLIRHQAAFFLSQGIKQIYVVTQSPSKELREACIGLPVEIIEGNKRGNAGALSELAGKITCNFVVMAGDTLNHFDLRRMVSKHRSLGKLATMGLMTRESSKSFGSVVLDGDFIIDFREKTGSSHIVNAGVYVFKPEIFELLSGSLEKDVFPKLAKLKELIGHFTYGEYEHFG
ncbi:MAG: sugar phosphate nucleotidyltransferase [Nanoarchaeota archaeon]|nr:sugar phosphate nucleotidyltransferase [Nanoarchaeota archaeon]